MAAANKNSSTDTWDLTPFLSAPAVLARQKLEGGAVQVVNIPDSLIPSPLAENLSPGTVLSVKQFLCGSPSRKSSNSLDPAPGSSGSSNGPEVWASWKRAWDIWQNHYIPDRVNPLWIAEVYPDKKKEIDERDDEARRIEREKTWGKQVRANQKVTFSRWHAAPASKGPGESLGQAEKGSDKEKEKEKEKEEEIVHPFAHSAAGLSTLGASAARSRDGQGRASVTPMPSDESIQETGNSSRQVHSYAHTSGSSLTPKFDNVKIIEPPKPQERSRSSIRSIHESLSSSESESNLDNSPKKSDGRSGGWVPMKDLPYYRYPEDPELPEDHPEQVAWEELMWDDPIENTVWRPRRVGEKILNIEIDGDDIGGDPVLTVNGGVDCGREPYPVLRPLFQYSSGDDSAKRKKKIWDGVTGTIFNMPTNPLERDQESDNEKHTLVKKAYSDPLRDAQYEDGTVFPLDIRRVEKVILPYRAVKPTPLVGDDEEVLIGRDYPLGVENRPLRETNPWYVTKRQELLRDHPTRQWPPGVEKNSALLPTDDRIWREELGKDQDLLARYFVTNLHGGTLLINGQQVRKGCIAGPLPAFAVIETPGGQVSFWWGIEGRNYKGEPKRDLERKWPLLRIQKGWENVAESAGEVWDRKIIERARAERTGNRNDDDEEWTRWKITKKAKPKIETYAAREFPLDAEPRFTETDHEDIELRWLAAVVLRNREIPPDYVAPFIEPTAENFWEGRRPRSNSKRKPLTGIEIDHLWNSQGAGAKIEKIQKAYVQELERKKRVAEEELKRQSDLLLEKRRKEKLQKTSGPDQHKRKADSVEQADFTIDESDRWEAEREKKRQLHAAAQAERVRTLTRDAQLAQYLIGVPSDEVAAVTNEFEQYEALEKAKERRVLKKVNEKRKQQGLPELPAREVWEAKRFKRPIPAEETEEAERERVDNSLAHKKEDLNARSNHLRGYQQKKAYLAASERQNTQSPDVPGPSTQEKGKGKADNLPDPLPGPCDTSRRFFSASEPRETHDRDLQEALYRSFQPSHTPATPNPLLEIKTHH